MKKIYTAILAIAAIAMASMQNLSACTGITLRTKGGDVVAARTIEWAASDMNALYVVVPRGHVWQSLVPDGANGMRFTAEYGYVGLAVEQPEFITEGLNEAGLSAGLFYFPDYGKYQDYDRAEAYKSVADLQLVSYILGCCANVDDVKRAIGNIRVHALDPRASTVHWRFTEPSGRQIVLEIIDGKCVFYENELGVLTNSPSLDWHLANLNNYVNLNPGKVASNRIGRMELSAFSGGTGLRGLPGDFTSPSRFVRAAFFQSSAPVKEKVGDTVAQAFHILNNFDIPVGSQYSQNETPADIPSATQFTAASDLSGLKLYYRTMHNSSIRCIDLSKINFAKARFLSRPLDGKMQENIVMVNPQ